MEENEPGQHLPYLVLSDRHYYIMRCTYGIRVLFVLHARPAMAKVAASPLAVSSAAAFAPQQPSSTRGISLYRSRIVCKRARISAKLGGNGELKPQGKKKFITKEEEPEQYWQTAGERKGENPMMTPLPYIIIFGMSVPFVILAIAFANGWIKVPVR